MLYLSKLLEKEKESAPSFLPKALIFRWILSMFGTCTRSLKIVGLKITTQYWLDNLQNNADDLILYFKFVFIEKGIRVIEKAMPSLQ